MSIYKWLVLAFVIVVIAGAAVIILLAMEV